MCLRASRSSADSLGTEVLKRPRNYAMAGERGRFVAWAYRSIFFSSVGEKATPHMVHTF